MSDIAHLEDKLNNLILEGQILEAVEQFYAEDCEMQENTEPPVVGKAANLEREKQFLAAVEEFHGVQLLGGAAREDRSYSEWVLDVTMKEVGRVTYHQVAAREWRDGQVARERFYYNPG